MTYKDNKMKNYLLAIHKKVWYNRRSGLMLNIIIYFVLILFWSFIITATFNII